MEFDHVITVRARTPAGDEIQNRIEREVNIQWPGIFCEDGNKVDFTFHWNKLVLPEIASASEEE